MYYSTHWRLAYILAFFFHLSLWLLVTLLIPNLFRNEPQTTPIVMELVALDGFGSSHDASEGREDEVSNNSNSYKPSQAEINSVAVLEAVIPEEGIVEDITPSDIKDTLSVEPDNAEITPHSGALGSSQTLMVNAKLIHEEQPVVGAIPFYGTVNIRAFLDKEGKVYKTEITRGTGNTIYNIIAENMVKRWKFTPATDINGEPMSTKYICTLYFNGKPHRKN